MSTAQRNLTPAALHNNHDQRLSAWGPYTKRYIGVSHIPDVRAGLRFDLSVFPGIYRRSVNVPNVLWDSGYHPWEAAPDLAYYSHRHQLIWQDQLYTDIAYCRLDEQSVLVHCTAVNASDAPQQLSLHYAASLNFPPFEPYSQQTLTRSTVALPKGAQWINAMDYTEVQFDQDDFRATLSTDGQRRGENLHVYGAVDGICLGDGWGTSPTDFAKYRITLPTPLANASLIVHAFAHLQNPAQLQFDGLGNRQMLELGSYAIQPYRLELGPLHAGEHELTITPLPLRDPMSFVDINGFVIVESTVADQVKFEPSPWQPKAKHIKGPVPDRTLLLEYADTEVRYGLAWGVQPSVMREVHAASLDDILRYKVHEHVNPLLFGEGEGYYTNILMQPIFLDPGEQHTSVGLVCSGSHDDVRQRLQAFDPEPATWQATIDAARAKATHFTPNPAGEAYTFSQQRMAATLATNVVYPVRTRGTWIRNYTPGRWWDCLYTWDSGFIGLGMLELDPERAVDILNAYLTPPGDTDAAFIHHGSPVPTQFYLFAEWWNRTQDRTLLAYFYPRLQQYHRFLAGRLGSSNTRTLKSGLIRTWDYWYNSGGWDDYPPQVYARNHDLYGRVTPVINSAQAIRTAKILRMAANELGEDSTEYDRDINELNDALQRHAWDADAGYFSYVLHDEAGQPTDFLRHSSNANFNMGMDGAYPLVADCATPVQSRQLIDHLLTPGRMWTPIGLSTVDQRAPYYRDDGYWNGAVWMAHQWFFWKALLDHGEAEAAYRIAHTALELWQTEVARTYNCYEHFVIGSGRGAGWHHFGALSAPVLNWFHTYHIPGHLTVGHNVWVTARELAPDHHHLDATLVLDGKADQRPTVIATLAPDQNYRATWNGAQLATHTRHQGTIEVTLPTGHGQGQLVIESAA